MLFVPPLIQKCQGFLLRCWGDVPFLLLWTCATVDGVKTLDYRDPWKTRYVWARNQLTKAYFWMKLPVSILPSGGFETYIMGCVCVSYRLVIINFPSMQAAGIIIYLDCVNQCLKCYPRREHSHEVGFNSFCVCKKRVCMYAFVCVWETDRQKQFSLNEPFLNFVNLFIAIKISAIFNYDRT